LSEAEGLECCQVEILTELGCIRCRVRLAFLLDSLSESDSEEPCAMGIRLPSSQHGDSLQHHI
jgi:hypothetical protein